jgi:hypothetical protein
VALTFFFSRTRPLAAAFLLRAEYIHQLLIGHPVFAREMSDEPPNNTNRGDDCDFVHSSLCLARSSGC